MIAFLDNALFSLVWPWSFLIVVLLMVPVALVAYWKRSLDGSGAAAAFAMGIIVLWSLRFEGFLLLMLFFVSCNVVGRFSKAKAGKGDSLHQIEKKGSRRDVMQVMSNGLMATIAALMWLVLANNAALIMFGASVAEATSDTFAGEIGRLSKKEPVSIRTLRPVPKGLSGGVTVLGTMAALLSSMAIALCWFLWFPNVGLSGALLVALLGFAGAVLDSWLGACVQAIYQDPETGEYTEHEQKSGRNLELVRGIRWVDNDMVNLMSNVFSSVFALGMSALVL